MISNANIQKNIQSYIAHFIMGFAMRVMMEMDNDFYLDMYGTSRILNRIWCINRCASALLGMWHLNAQHLNTLPQIVLYQAAIWCTCNVNTTSRRTTTPQATYNYNLCMDHQLIYCARAQSVSKVSTIHLPYFNTTTPTLVPQGINKTEP